MDDPLLFTLYSIRALIHIVLLIFFGVSLTRYLRSMSALERLVGNDATGKLPVANRIAIERFLSAPGNRDAHPELAAAYDRMKKHLSNMLIAGCVLAGLLIHQHITE